MILKTIFLIYLAILVQSQLCDLDNNFLYNKACISFKCRDDALSQMKLTPTQDGINLGALTNAIAYSFKKVEGAEITFNLNVRWNDPAKTLLYDRTNCLDYRLYATMGAFNDNPVRKFVKTEGAVPTWPVSTYSYNSVFLGGEVKSTLKLGDLTQCSYVTVNSLMQYTCYFELAFVLQGTTQEQYYFSIRLKFDPITKAQVGDITFSPIVESKPRCPDGDTNCEATVAYNSNVLFCFDETCSTTTEKVSDLQSLYLNKPIYLKHYLPDTAASQQYYLRSPITINFKSSSDTEIKITEKSTDMKLLKSDKGYNYLMVKAPFVQKGVTLTITATLSQTRRMLQGMQEEKLPTEGQQAFATINLGDIQETNPIPPPSSTSTSQVSNSDPSSHEDDSSETILIAMLFSNAILFLGSI